MEFGRRIALEREISASSASGPLSGLANASSAALWNVTFDESGNFIIYGSLHGVKFVNLVTDRCVRLLGKDESVRFMNVALFQGAPDKKTTSLAAAASENPLLAKQGLVDPTLFATAYWAGEVLHVHPCRSGCDEWVGRRRLGRYQRESRRVQRAPHARGADHRLRHRHRQRSQSLNCASSTTTKHSAATLHTTLGESI